ncbi:hypothetical protein TRFO_17835 [Tritrichomonas foetus]|uniref:Polymorphic outer membrane protein n=1 Tax=Tritrichomonas foetus TaxID=1144522 RepID=A0A1J4KRR1_9EUKA|nr:hypothetical protein TRFO_17835 [Tritrichomonas foetus]|eukprot:OHT12358.1 hypothetical protein TRFO_17835 [Tritrichomonas foetus]
MGFFCLSWVIAKILSFSTYTIELLKGTSHFHRNRHSLIFSQVSISGLYTSRTEYVTSGAFQITSAYFYQCQSPTIKGGAVLLELKTGTFTLSRSAFVSCTSGIDGGGIYFTGQAAKLSFTCFSDCYSVTHDSCYFYTTGATSLNNELAVFYCGGNGKTSSGPTVGFTGNPATIRGLNLSNNQFNTKNLIGSLAVIEATTDYTSTSSISYSLFSQNVGTFTVFSESHVMGVNYNNFVNNSFRLAIFGVAKYKLSSNYNSIIGEFSYDPNIHNTDVIAYLLDKEASFMAYGCQISYPRFNISAVEGNSGQFNRKNIMTISIPYYGEQQCVEMMNSIASINYTGLIFPNQIQNITAIALVAVIAFITIGLFVYLEFINVRVANIDDDEDDGNHEF